MRLFINVLLCTVLFTQISLADAWFSTPFTNYIKDHGGKIETACPALCADWIQRTVGSNGNWISGLAIGHSHPSGLAIYQGGCAGRGDPHDPALKCRCDNWKPSHLDANCG